MRRLRQRSAAAPAPRRNGWLRRSVSLLHLRRSTGDAVASEVGVRSPCLTAWSGRGGGGAAIIVAAIAAAARARPDAAMAADTPASDTTLLPVTAAPSTAFADSEIKARLDAPGTLTIAGEPVHAALLRRFYAGANFEPVWATRQAQATALWHAVLSAGDHGLDPDLFHVGAFAKTALSATDRDMLLSDAFLGYPDALARVVVPSEARTEDEDLSPGTIDVVAVLDEALVSPSPEATIEALAPRSPEYAALQRAYQSYQAIVKAGGWRHAPESPTPARNRLLQQRLAAEGFLRAGYATNVFDEPTIEALKKFQARSGFE